VYADGPALHWARPSGFKKPGHGGLYVTSDSFSEEMEERAIDCFMQHVGELHYGDQLIKDVFQAIVDPEKENEYLDDEGKPPTKSELADRIDYNLSAISGKTDFWTGADTVDTDSLWEALELVGLVDIFSMGSWSDRVQRNDVICSAFRGPLASIREIPDPARAENEQERRRLEERRRMMARFGLNLLSKCRPEVLHDAPVDSFPRAYTNAPPQDVLYGVTAENLLSVQIDQINVTRTFEEDEVYTDRNDNFWQIYVEVDLVISDHSPFRDPIELEYYFQRESRQLLKTVMSDGELQYCSCESVEDHVTRTLSGLLIGANEGQLARNLKGDDEESSQEDETTDDTGENYCTVADNSTIELYTTWHTGEVKFTAIWGGFTKK
jgi:hypothetical protein